MTFKEEMNIFYENWRKIDLQYEEYAKSVGLSYTSMKILYHVYNTGDGVCTQKGICEKTTLPKQTVNSIISSFIKQGYLKLVECPEDRRSKMLLLTEHGRVFCQEIFGKIDHAETCAWESISPEKRRLLNDVLKEYVIAFGKAMK